MIDIVNNPAGAAQLSEAVLAEAVMLREMFADYAYLAVQRRIAWAFDCAKIDEAMHWLDVETAMYGLPI